MTWYHFFLDKLESDKVIVFFTLLTPTFYALQQGAEIAWS
jgi:hypothetical protein